MGAQEQLGNMVANVANFVIEKLSAFFRAVFNFLRRALNKVLSLFPNRVVNGMKTLYAKIEGRVKNVAKTYTMDKATGEWKETVITQSVEENEIPEHIRKKLSVQSEVDYTEELVNELRQAS